MQPFKINYLQLSAPRRVRERGVSGGLAVACAVLATADAPAGPLADYLDSIDFNDYALSLNYYASESPYAGAPDTSVVYPMLSSFEHSTTTTQVLFLRDAYMGLRRVSPAGWTLGAVATVQTAGYGPTTSDELAGMEKRGWTVAAGLLAGYAAGPVHADLFATTDLFGEHGGQVYDLKLAWPIVARNLEVVPQLQISQYSDDYVNYYYGVEPGEASAERPVWLPGAAMSYTAGMDLTWRFRPDWFLRASVSLEQLPDEMANSPIVDVDDVWRFGVGVAYDTGNFVRMRGDTALASSEVEIAVEAFLMRADSAVTLEGSSPDQAARLEDVTNLDDSPTAFPLTLTWRIGRYHALGVRYFELFRDGAIELAAPRRIGGRDFAAGSTLDTSLATRVLRADYGFAIFRDPQKELAVVGGLHATRFEYAAEAGNERVAAETNAVLPMIGANLRASFTPRLALHLALELFLLDFDQYSGSLIDIAAEGRYALNRTWSIGAGYRYYRQELESGDDSLVGDVRIDNRGPFLALNLTF